MAEANNENRRKRCYYCEREYGIFYHGYSQALYNTSDHVIPKSRGGNNLRVNLVSCCQYCNWLKGNSIPEELAIRLTKELEQGNLAEPQRRYYETILKNLGNLINTIEPYRKSLYVSEFWAEETTDGKVTSHGIKLSLGIPAGQRRTHNKPSSKPETPQTAAIQQAGQLELPQWVATTPVIQPKPPLTLEGFTTWFKKRYPYMFGLLEEVNPDYPRWLFDNVIVPLQDA